MTRSQSCPLPSLHSTTAAMSGSGGDSCGHPALVPRVVILDALPPFPAQCEGGGVAWRLSQWACHSSIVGVTLPFPRGYVQSVWWSPVPDWPPWWRRRRCCWRRGCFWQHRLRCCPIPLDPRIPCLWFPLPPQLGWYMRRWYRVIVKFRVTKIIWLTCVRTPPPMKSFG